ncbi:MAG TPA: right-handed parallel beta-helix repeat-containing protein [Kofleriaceae bacterium]|nr:right-handed parallel beta-helix repeat-containing protein [Kofleriaceae bacterium]
MPLHFTSFASLFASLVLALVLAACIRPTDPNYCPGKNPNNNCLDPFDPKPCTASAECSGATPVCDRDDTQMCVACTAGDAGACTGATPVCGADHACRACTEHAECGAAGCLPDGSCGDDTRVAYVDRAGFDNLSCTSASPCTRVSRALATNRPYVKLAGVLDEQVVVSGGRIVTFVGGPDVKLTTVASGPGPTVTVRDDGTSLTIYDLSISDAQNSVSGLGLRLQAGGAPHVTLVRSRLLNNAVGGILAEGSGILTVTQSLIARNVGGGISVLGGTFAAVGNAFYGNGSPVTSTGGIRIATMQGGNRLEFNSFHMNAAASGTGPAIHCASVLVAARNNIMSENGTTSSQDQVAGNCTHAYSIVRPGMLPSGAGNTNADPLFVSPTTGDLHIRLGSPARGAADPSSSLMGLAERDLDGDVRISPADVGADEVP